eukprot:scaffold5421_cov350-Prasinococcus_capsulatus_cf.AAC.1
MMRRSHHHHPSPRRSPRCARPSPPRTRRASARGRGYPGHGSSCRGPVWLDPWQRRWLGVRMSLRACWPRPPRPPGGGCGRGPCGARESMGLCKCGTGREPPLSWPPHESTLVFAYMRRHRGAADLRPHKGTIRHWLKGAPAGRGSEAPPRRPMKSPHPGLVYPGLS